jgi:hypothetical protein
LEERWLGPLKAVSERELTPEELQFWLGRRRSVFKKRLIGHSLLWGTTVVPFVLSTSLFFGNADHLQPHLLLFSMFGCCFPALVGMGLLGRARESWPLLRPVSTKSKGTVYSGRVPAGRLLNVTVAELVNRGILEMNADRDQTITVVDGSGLVIEANGKRCEREVGAFSNKVSATPKMSYAVPFYRGQYGKDGETKDFSISGRKLEKQEVSELKAVAGSLLALGVPFGCVLGLGVAGLVTVVMILIAGDVHGTEGIRLRSWGIGAKLPLGLGAMFFCFYLEVLVQWAVLLWRDARLGKTVVYELSGETARWETLPRSRIPWIEGDKPASWRSDTAVRRFRVFMRSKPPVRSYLKPW